MPQELVNLKFLQPVQKAFTYLISLKPAELKGLVVLGHVTASELRVNITKENQHLFLEN